ncbi:MAG TPA: hypothetical protein VGN32_12355, partial [Ktedonobacterales bacterium]|nr:hypothetical protein [Ktedonobacterales bacterium]
MTYPVRPLDLDLVVAHGYARWTAFRAARQPNRVTYLPWRHHGTADAAPLCEQQTRGISRASRPSGTVAARLCRAVGLHHSGMLGRRQALHLSLRHLVEERVGREIEGVI